ncbi:helix-turn-helix transcriptional regulator [Mycolicibacterium litorale]|uniref:HTH araC/xylS-type domain-containing protein n=1 Tax=Mycolicibacterium litorale TaxID=758802 RepID=A0AAD1MW92_9MYCO|nr:helix-turn-helix transcriptional regulator [Mycolicibacterium litorale]MCV7418440.1 helix-turn-helix transcriptional regulator [Mycolicibacterium litorale]TDY06162.1 AraC family transcriptional regulator [Mycolicibacterium litorale]BBY19695.1 hypothetical protein MLIT_52870 [Mycolicibacterium litorale]
MRPISTLSAHPRRPTRTRVEVTRPDEVGEFLDETYGARLRLSQTADARRGDGPLLTHARVDAGSFTIDDVELAGRVDVSPDPLHKVVAVWTTSGRISGTCDGLNGRAGAGEVAMLAQPDLPYRAQAEDVALTSVLLDPALVARVATGTPESQVSLPIRFATFEPVDGNAHQMWRQTVEYVKTVLLQDDSAATPLVLGHAGRLLAAVTLSAFAGASAVAASVHDRNDAKDVLLRRAVEYIHCNAAADIALGDIAQAVHVSPRAVQYMFRRHLDTTPLQYLRGLRLQHAHQDLLAADRTHETVTQIAAKWGFAHTGRFAVAYREKFRVSPHLTLRGGERPHVGAAAAVACEASAEKGITW